MPLPFPSSRCRGLVLVSALLVGLAPSRAATPTSDTVRVPNVAVLPLSAQGVDSASALVLTDALSDELLNSGKVRVMERSQMSEVLKEQGFQQSGSCDQSKCAVEMGKMLGIDKIVVGSLGRFGGTYTLTLRGVNVGTGEVEVSVRRMQKGEMDAILTDLLPPLANELAIKLSGEDSLPSAAVAVPEIPAPVVATDIVPAAEIAPTPPATVDSVSAAAVDPAPVVAIDAISVAATDSVPEAAAVAPAAPASSHWVWWVAGGAVVLGGGAVAAVLLSGDSGGGSSDTPPSSAPAEQTLHVVQP